MALKRGRRPKRRSQGDVELNMAAMLDMAFQLLAFFILTFRPSPVESQISLRLPRPISTSAPAASVQPGPEVEVRTENVPIAIYATNDGEIARIVIGSRSLTAQQVPEATMAGLGQELAQVLAAAPFDGAAVQVSPKLRYERLMQVVDVCTRQTLTNGQPLTSIALSEMADNAE
jgi:biopolymer transport protein ExbD